MLEPWTVVLIVVGIVVWLALLIGVIWLRGWSKGRFEPKLPDAIIAALPILIVLVATGVIKLGITPGGGVTAEADKAILAASKQNVGAQVTALQWTPVDASEKGGLGDLKRVVAERKPGLSFSLAQHGYFGEAIREYLDALVKDPTFRYVIIANVDKSLFGLFDGRKLNDILKAGPSSNFDEFASALDHGDKGKLSSYPGFVSGELAIRRSTPKDEALQRMEKNNLNLEWLPVVDERGDFVGIVDRTRLIASLILDVTDKLKEAQAKPSM